MNFVRDHLEMDDFIMKELIFNDEDDEELLIKYGSRAGRSPNIDRMRVERHDCLMKDYFVENCVYHLNVYMLFQVLEHFLTKCCAFLLAANDGII